MNFGDMAKVLGLEESEFRDMLELFVETTLVDLQALKVAVAQDAPRAVMEASHSIKGAARSFGFAAISSSAETLERNARQNDLNGSGEAIEAIQSQLDRIILELRS